MTETQKTNFLPLWIDLHPEATSEAAQFEDNVTAHWSGKKALGAHNVSASDAQMQTQENTQHGT